ncbi:MAG: nucleotidyl transferase AbiEii/AbiGii toxin family protein [Coriobacteriia bacterium]|nr:nucleotidyl transferase AbiEii/AbiGii toxin family protein [Coriobacteriia bacterium]
MIPQAAITEWRNTVPWQNMHQVEQDLILCRALAAIYSDDVLASSLAFRGGTALHKLFLSPQARYSEDLDFVQVNAEPIGPTLDRLRSVLAFLGESKTKRKTSNNVMLLSFETTFPPVIELRIKIEINCKEHFVVQDWAFVPFSVDSLWFSGECSVLTYQLEELIGTKLRAMYQRKKGRDLFDLAYVSAAADLDLPKVIECYKQYMTFQGNHLPTASEYAANLEAKMSDRGFREDVLPMLRAEVEYDVDVAFQKVADIFVSLM